VAVDDRDRRAVASDALSSRAADAAPSAGHDHDPFHAAGN
jgi:hypothetical protein